LLLNTIPGLVAEGSRQTFPTIIPMSIPKRGAPIIGTSEPSQIPTRAIKIQIINPGIMLDNIPLVFSFKFFPKPSVVV
jgi:hypothetical protein